MFNDKRIIDLAKLALKKGYVGLDTRKYKVSFASDITNRVHFSVYDWEGGYWYRVVLDKNTWTITERNKL